MSTIASPAGRRLPWNVMGGTMHQQFPTVQDALAATHLDYQVEVRDLFSARPVSTLDDAAALPVEQTHTDFIQAPSLRTIVRPMPDGTEQVLAAVGTRYTPIQNPEAFAVADLLVQEFGATISGAADFRSGGASLLVVDLNRPVTLETKDGLQDVTDLHLMIKNAHDGSAALTFALTGIRIACTNAVQAAVAGAKRTWKISHTPNAQQRVDLARQSIIAAMTYQDAFQAQAQAMLDTAMTEREFDRIVAGLWPVDAAAQQSGDLSKAQTRALEVRDEVRDLYATSDTLEGIRGSLWGGYNALTEWYDWERPVRGGEVSRAEGALEGPYVRRKAAIWDTFAAAV